MENSKLYDLPKDMLVKLITTIREDTRKEVLNEIKEKLKVEEIQVMDCDYCEKSFSEYHEWKTDDARQVASCNACYKKYKHPPDPLFCTFSEGYTINIENPKLFKNDPLL